MKKYIAALALFLTLGVISLYSFEGEHVGVIGSINPSTKEIVVTSPEAAEKIKMGDTLYVRVSGKVVTMTATFPMQTLAKCSLTPESADALGSVKKGMDVFRFSPEVRVGASSLGKGRPGQIKTIGSVELVYVPAGQFMMGSPDNQSGSGSDEHPQHMVSVDGFWIGKCEITQKQYQEIMGENRSDFQASNRHPVEKVSHDDAVEFCKRFQERYGIEVMLPTEAQWEYACRAGSKTVYHWGNTIDDKCCWHGGNSQGSTHPVGQKRPNAFGLYDMSGNVWEWCADWYDARYYDTKSTVNPRGPEKGAFRVVRGGSWDNNDNYISSSYRYRFEPNKYFNKVGFRIVAPAR